MAGSLEKCWSTEPSIDEQSIQEIRSRSYYMYIVHSCSGDWKWHDADGMQHGSCVALIKENFK